MDTNMNALLERNRAFAASGAWHNTPLLPFLPFKGLYIVTCIDPRTDPADFLGLQFADAIVAREVGGRVTDAVIEEPTSATSSKIRLPRAPTLRLPSSITPVAVAGFSRIPHCATDLQNARVTPKRCSHRSRRPIRAKPSRRTSRRFSRLRKSAHALPSRDGCTTPRADCSSASSSRCTPVPHCNVNRAVSLNYCTAEPGLSAT
jgi:hypothetical protein